MKFIKWKSLIITCVVCLLPILLGLALMEKLPDSMAIHFNINGEADNFTSKEFVVFGLPVLMAFMNIFSCIVTDFNSYKHGEREKFDTVIKWIIPVIVIVLQIATLGYGLGWNIDMRKIAVIIVGAMFLVLGNYLPKLDYIKNYDLDTEKARKINRFVGFETVIMGILFLATALLPPIYSVICLLLLVPYTLIGVIYGIKVARSNS